MGFPLNHDVSQATSCRETCEGEFFMLYKTDALVLRAADYGENDKIITLFSLQYGKISAALKGVKKAGAKLKFAAQPFCFAEFVLAKKGEHNTVTSASLTDGFYPLREDIGKFYAAASLAGICDSVLYDGIVNEELFLRAVNALREMCEGDEAEARISFFSESARTFRLYALPRLLRGLRGGAFGQDLFRSGKRLFLLRRVRARRGCEPFHSQRFAQVRGHAL